MSTGFPEVTEADWLAEAARSLKGRPVSDLGSRTADGIKIKALHARAPAPPAIPAAPSTPPLVVPLVIEADPDTANGVILAELDGGAAGVVVQMAAPGQTGLPMAPEALHTAFAGVDLDAATLLLAPGNSDWARATETFATMVSDTAGQPSSLDLGADPIGAAMGADDGVSPAGIAALADFAGSLTGYPNVRVFRASGLPAHEAGATEAQELAAMLASGIAYLKVLETTDLPPWSAANRIGFELAADTDVFVTIAKFRAARLLWGRVAELCGGGFPRAHLHGRSSARMMAKRDIHVNMLRTTAAAFAAAAGGANSLTILPFTHPLGRPDEMARRIARNTMTILAEEAYVGTVADPASGSGFAEHLSHELAAKAWHLFQDIEAAGGGASPAGAALLHDKVRKADDIRKAEIAAGTRRIVGVNAFVNTDDTPPKVAPWPA